MRENSTTKKLGNVSRKRKLIGNKNALRHGVDGYLNIRCVKSEKEKWRLAAEKEKLPLSDWVRRILNLASNK